MGGKGSGAKVPTKKSRIPDRGKLAELAAGPPPPRKGATLFGKPIAEIPPPQPKRDLSKILPRDLVAKLIKAPYAAVARKYEEPRWCLSDEEADYMVDAHLEAATRYLPPWLMGEEEGSPLLKLALMHGAMVVARIDLMQRSPEELNAARPTPVEGKPVVPVRPTPATAVEQSRREESLDRSGPLSRAPGNREELAHAERAPRIPPRPGL